MAATRDPSTLSNYTDALVTHTDLVLDVSFDAKTISGVATLRVNKVNPDATTLVLDNNNLTITNVSTPLDGKQLSHSFGEPHKVLGTPLVIDLPATASDAKELQIAVEFRTSPSSSAVQWLDPAQTAGGKDPYLFTQCQAIHARALLPCQDTPGAKMTYTAAVRVPEELTALMSAVPLDGPPEGTAAAPPKAGTRVFYFNQAVPIPPYLLALAVGELEKRDLSARSAVWSEPSMVDAGAYEFADTAQYLEAGEQIAGEYVWGRYDLLLLPPSFPYGGMENPCLTFVTPTLLTGDRSLTSVVAHEIAHSWTGNLVTNASWEHFWLNEGWTVFLERKILGHLRGEKVFQFEAALGLQDLLGTLKTIGESHPFTCLSISHQDGVDPDDAFSTIPYEKGFYFLYYLQELVGGAAKFEPFIKDYLKHFRFQAITTQDFKDYFLNYFKDCEAIKQIDWQTWLYAPGMPPVQNNYDTSLAQAAYDLALKWHTCDVMGMGGNVEGASAADIEGWSSNQLGAFLEKLLEYRSLTPAHKTTTRNMDKAYHLSDSRNAEVQCAWYKLCIGAEDDTVLPGVVDLLERQGRMKFLRPLYRALYRSKMGRQLALDTYEAKKDGYHPIARKMVAVDLQLVPSE